MAVMSKESGDSNADSIFWAEWWTSRLAAPVIAAAIVRMGLLAVTLNKLGVAALTREDTASYLEPGRNLLLHGRFIADGAPDVLRTPGYSLYLAITSLAGLPAAAAANVVLSVISVVLTWKLGRVVFSDGRIALGAAWIFALEPISVANSILLMSDTLFLVFFLLSVERIAVFLRERDLRVLAVSGLWLAAATFVRPVTYYLPVALALGLFLVFVRVEGLRWKAPAVLLISVMPWLAAWQVRNWVETGYAGFSSATEINLYFLAAVNVTSHVEHRPFLTVRDELGYVGFADNSGQSYLSKTYLARHPEQTEWSQGKRLAFMHAEALRVIRAHYWVYLRLCLTSLFQPVFNPGGGSYFDLPLSRDDPSHGSADPGLARWRSALARASALAVADKAVYGLILLGLYFFAMRGVVSDGLHNVGAWLLLGITLYLLAITGAMGGNGGGARYRLPVMPIISIFAAAGVLHKKSNLQSVCTGTAANNH